MEIFDCHTHIYPEPIAQKASDSIGGFYGISMHHSGSAEELSSACRAAGIAKEVVCSAAVTPKQVHSINDFIAAQCASHPDFIGLGTLHTGFDEYAAENDNGNGVKCAVDEVERMISLGLHGVKLHPDMQLFNVDDERLFPAYEAMQGRLSLLVHAGDYRTDFSHPRRIRHIKELFPRLTVIAAHFGGWSVPEIALDHLKDTDCFFDVSSSISFTGKRRAAELIRIYGAERMLFGSDFPMWDPQEELDTFRQLGLSINEERMILSENPLRAFGL